MIATVHPIPVVRARRAPAETTGAARVARVFATVFGAAVLAAGLVYAAGSDARAVRGLPAEARTALLARTLQNLESLCSADRNTPLTSFCQDQARVALAVPECDPACVALARGALRGPTR